MNNLVRPMADIINFNTVNIKLAIEDLTEEEAKKRILGGYLNSVSFELGHMLGSRFNMANMIGLNEKNPWKEIFGNKVNDGEEYPTIKALEEEWDRLGALLKDRFETITDEEVMVQTDNQFPMQEKTVRGGLAFLTWHESYHLGQVGAIRTALQKDPIKDVFHKKHG
ncbi:MAG: DinB family protein [bacterium]|nr:DinB family protein [bacterium]